LAAQAIGSVAALALLSLPAQGASAAFAAIYVANRRLGSAFALNSIALVTFGVIGLVLLDRYGVLGLAAAYSAVQWLLACALLAGLQGKTGIPLPPGLFTGIGRVSAIGLLGFAPFYLLLRLATLDAVGLIVVALAGCAAGILLALVLSPQAMSKAERPAGQAD
jgi:hypothetical protein